MEDSPRAPDRYQYHIKTPQTKVGVFGNDLELMKYFADKWALERAVPHMVIDREGNLVHHAFAPQDRSK